MKLKFPTVTLLFLMSRPAQSIPALDSRTVTGYAVRNFNRDCTDPHICTYKFYIDSVAELVPCTIVDAVPAVQGSGKFKITGPVATTHPWYDKPCIEVPSWRISWGWNYEQDFTVMTVKHGPPKLEAFFGYSHPNIGLPVVKYPDNGPNPVQSTGE